MIKIPTVKQIEKRFIFEFKEKINKTISHKELSAIKEYAEKTHLFFFGRNEKDDGI